MHRPPHVGDRSAERQKPPPRTGCPSVHGFTQARTAVTPMVLVSQLIFESGPKRRRLTVGAGVRGSPLMAGASNAGQHGYIAAIEPKRPGPGPRPARPGASRVFPHSVSLHLPTGDQARDRVRGGANGRFPSLFGAGAGSTAHLPAAGDRPVRSGRTVPLRSLRRRPSSLRGLINRFTAPVSNYLIYRTSAKNLWVAYSSKRNYEHTRASRNCRVNFRGSCPESAKRHPPFCYKVAETRSYEHTSRPPNRFFLTLLAVMYTRACENAMAETMSPNGAYKGFMVHYHPV